MYVVAGNVQHGLTLLVEQGASRKKPTTTDTASATSASTTMAAAAFSSPSPGTSKDFDRPNYKSDRWLALAFV
jgi:hypothetical protein